MAVEGVYTRIFVKYVKYNFKRFYQNIKLTIGGIRVFLWISLIIIIINLCIDWTFGRCTEINNNPLL